MSWCRVIHIAPNQITEWSGRATIFSSSLLCSCSNTLTTLLQVEDCVQRGGFQVRWDRGVYSNLAESSQSKPPNLPSKPCWERPLWLSQLWPREFRVIGSELAADPRACKCLLKYRAEQQLPSAHPRHRDGRAKGL